MKMNQINQFLEAAQTNINKYLYGILTSQTEYPNRLHEAMHYTVMNGGKRLRPALVYAAGQTFGAPFNELNIPAAAVELIHCYSLVHDDLPAMDDDDLRRGQATCHKAFDEATAILVGDALQSLAFELLAKEFTTPSRQLQMIHLLAYHAGAKGMVAGQELDLLAEQKKINLNELETIHHLKTGALIRASIQLGALTTSCDENDLLSLDQYAVNIGLAFQIQDDILDIESNTQTLGKQAGADLALQKATYPAVTSLEQAKQKVLHLHRTANQYLQTINADTSLLTQLSDFVINRNY